jgi:DHA2 family multidrug resistance protein
MPSSIASTQAADGMPPCGLRRAITITCVLIVILELMDVTIVNVALPDIQGSLTASPSSITWVITAYTMASALMTPLTGFLAKKFGRRRLLILDIPLFILFSILCGFAHSLIEIIFTRFLQGMAAGTMIPCAEAALMEAYPLKERSKAMSFFGVGVLLGPIFGPFIGGYIDQYINWRAVFFVNIPFGIIALSLAAMFIKESATKKISPDYIGLIFMWIAIICLETFLAEGNQHGWFGSHIILLLFVLSILGFIGFIWKTLSAKIPIVNLRIFKDRNYKVAAIFVAVYGTPLLGAMTLLPLMFDEIFNYPPSLSGLMLLLRGASAMAIMPLIIKTQKFIDLRVYLIIGAILAGVGSLLFAHISPQASVSNMILPLVLQGFATAFIMPNIMAIGFMNIPLEITDEASGLFSICRSLGFTFGVTASATAWDMFKQTTWNNIGVHINTFNPQIRPWLEKQNLTMHSKLTPATLGHLLQRHADMVAYTDVFRMIAIISFCLIILTLFIKKKKHSVA